MTLPLLLVIYDLSVNKGFKSSLKIKRYMAYLTTAGLYLILRAYALGGITPGMRDLKLSHYEYFINLFPLFSLYIEKLLMPLNLNAYYVFDPVKSLLEWKTISSAVVLFLFFIIAGLCWRKERRAFIALLWMTVTLLPVLYIPALGENVFAERYLYLPSAGFTIFASIWLTQAYEMHLNGRNTVLWKVSAIIMILTVLYAGLTMKRNTAWRDEYSLWGDTVRKSPKAATPHYNLGMAFMNMGQLSEAEREYQTAIRMKPDHVKARNNLGGLYLEQGRIAEAIKEFHEVITLKPDNIESHYNLAIAYARLGRLNEARSEFENVLKLNPGDMEATRALESLRSASPFRPD